LYPVSSSATGTVTGTISWVAGSAV
jgi:hypothetical protein